MIPLKGEIHAHHVLWLLRMIAHFVEKFIQRSILGQRRRVGLYATSETI